MLGLVKSLCPILLGKKWFNSTAMAFVIVTSRQNTVNAEVGSDRLRCGQRCRCPLIYLRAPPGSKQLLEMDITRALNTCDGQQDGTVRVTTSGHQQALIVLQ